MAQVDLSALFDRSQVDGPNRLFENVTLVGHKAGPHSLYLVRDPQGIRRALANGCQLFGGTGGRPKLLQGIADASWVRVQDLGQTCFQLGDYFRSQSAACRIVVTGSSGKTNTKDMITHLLRLRYPGTAKTPANYNGYYTVPLLLSHFPTNAPYWVVEIGMDYNRKNSIKPRADVTRPHAAVVTTVGFSHVAYLGSMEAVANEKSQVIRALQPDGLAVLNGDNRYCRAMAKLTTARVVFFGRGPDNDVRATKIKQTATGIRFDLGVGSESVKCNLRMIGLYHVDNALAAAAVALWAGLSLGEIAAGLSKYRPHAQHGKVYRARRAWLIDDGYNSNPTALQGVLDTLNAMHTNRRKILVLGDMQELGPYTDACYRQVANALRKTKVAGVVFYGKHVRRTYEALPRSAKYYWASNERDAVRALLGSSLSRNSLIWLKSNDYIEFGRLRRRLLSSLGWWRMRERLPR
jgi:UDP-N-acetylmuramoyl-tripeptide--D-alanyl-D-alanine ligase